MDNQPYQPSGREPNQPSDYELDRLEDIELRSLEHSREEPTVRQSKRTTLTNEIGEKHFDLVYDSMLSYCEEIVAPGSHDQTTGVVTAAAYCCKVPTRWFSGKVGKNARWARGFDGRIGKHLCELHAPKLTYQEALQEALIDYNRRDESRGRELSTQKGLVTRYKNELDRAREELAAKQARIDTMNPAALAYVGVRDRIEAVLKEMFEAVALTEPDDIYRSVKPTMATEIAMDTILNKDQQEGIRFLRHRRDFMKKRIKSMRKLYKALASLEAVLDDQLIPILKQQQTHEQGHQAQQVPQTAGKSEKPSKNERKVAKLDRKIDMLKANIGREAAVNA